MNERYITIAVVTIIDAPCGAGKTQWAIQEMNLHEEESYIYCTPFLAEVDRIKSNTKHGRFTEPEYYVVDESTGEFINTTKLDSFETLLASNKDIAVSHSTFLNATPETIQLIKDGEYTLILDESLDAVQEFNNIQPVSADCRQTMSGDDINMLVENKIITVGEYGKVTWCGHNRQPESKFREVERMAELGRLYLSRDKFLVAIFPPEMFSAFKKVYVLSYMIDAEILKYYFQLFGIEYDKASIEKDADSYKLVPYNTEADFQFRERCRELVHVCNEERLTECKRSLSKSWFDKNSKRKPGEECGIDRLKKDVQSFYRTCVPSAKASHNDVMWTCPKDYKKRLAVDKYKIVRSISNEDKKELSSEGIKHLERKLDCFVPCNARATNDFRERWALAYCCKLQRNPYIDALFTDHGIPVDTDAYSLASLIQWICRSRLRDGKPIELYLPSTQLRKLFLDWMNCK